MKWDARRLAAFVRQPDDAVRALLLHGPDAGMVRERAQAVIRAVVGAPPDPFRFADIAPERLRDAPTLLADEAATLGFTPGRRAVRVAGFAGLLIQPVARAAALLLESAGREALTVFEAGELESRSALRRAFEGARDAAAVGCYHDEGEALETLIGRTLAAREVAVAPDALAWLASRLGGDRAVTRAECEKLALHAGPGGTVTLAAAEALIGDSADIDIDDLVHALAEGDAPALERDWDRLAAGGVNAITIVRAVQRHLMRLQLGAFHVAQGTDPSAAVARLRPPARDRDAPRIERQLRRWPLARICAALDRLLELEIEAKSGTVPAELVVAHTLAALAR